MYQAQDRCRDGAVLLFCGVGRLGLFGGGEVDLVDELLEEDGL